jgi:ubiquinone/menaquinone biosynthesis C-methylase UbiE
MTPASMTDTKKLIAAGYDADADSFSVHADPLIYTRATAPLARELSRYPGPTLDVAAGTGALGRALGEAVAVDISHGQLVHNPTAMKVRADAEHLPFRDDSFRVAGCAFGINHFPDAGRAVAEMARVARVVGLITWERPERSVFAPKQIVSDIIAARAGASKTPSGQEIDRLSEEVGSERAVTELLRGADLTPTVTTDDVEIPWPGTERFVDYRMSMIGAARLLSDVEPARKEAIAAIEALDPSELTWRPRVVLGVGRRSAAV